MNEAVLILNAHRQIVFCNRHLLDLLGLDDASELYGMRPGEALGCIHSCLMPGGCGTAEFCSTCGAVSAILAGLGGNQSTRECRILRGPDGEAMDLLVRSTPLVIADQRFVILAILDVGHEKRRRALERVFFHDVMNTVTGLQMLSEGLAKADPEKLRRTAEAVSGAMIRLGDEITSQRDLMAAETNELPVRPVTVGTMQVLEELVATYARYRTADDVGLAVAPDSQNALFRSDVGIVMRVLGNMIKNAMEATDPGESVTIGCEATAQEVRFWVHNKAFIPRRVQLQLFKRSFSTKGDGRGLGTYSMKLLTEKFLKGRIEFTTSEAHGTTFAACFPLAI